MSRVFSIGEPEPEWIVPFYLVDGYDDGAGGEVYAAPWEPPESPLARAHPELGHLRGAGALLGVSDPMPWEHQPVPPDDRCTPQGVTLAVLTVDGRGLAWRQPLVDVTCAAWGTWAGDPELVDAADTAHARDPEAGSLFAVATAMLHAAGPGSRCSGLVSLLAQYHPVRDAPRRARCKDHWDSRRRDSWGA